MIHSHALNRSGDERFGERLLRNVKLNEWDIGVYPRNRKHWRGISPPTRKFFSDEETTRLGSSSLKMQSDYQGVRDIYTDYSARCLSPIPVLIHALKKKGLDERMTPEK